MVKDYPGEKWRDVKFDFEHINSYKIQISNFGRLKSFNKDSGGVLFNGAMVNGYRIVRIKFNKAKNEKTQQKISRLQKELTALTKEHAEHKKQKSSGLITEQEQAIKSVRKELNKTLKEDKKQRTINYHSLVHRLVASHFLPKPKPGEVRVAHLDYNKLNNRFDNLKWMTMNENFKHQQQSPSVIKEKQLRKSGLKDNTKFSKLTVTRVMLLKKLLNQNKPMKQLIKQFKVTDTQILRIKRGENWANIPAAQ